MKKFLAVLFLIFGISLANAQTLGPTPIQGMILLSFQAFVSSGTYTPTPGATEDYVTVIGQGGGGGGCASTSVLQNCVAGSGGAGSYAAAYILSPVAETVTIGTSGAGGAAGNNNGVPGGTVSFGSLISCPGGVAGAGSAAFTATTATVTKTTGSAPTACTISGSTNYITYPGQYPSPSESLGVLGAAFSPPGALSLYGSGGNGVYANGAGASGSGLGSGGSGAVSSNGGSAVAGGNPANGVIIIEEYGQ